MTGEKFPILTKETNNQSSPKHYSLWSCFSPPSSPLLSSPLSPWHLPSTLLSVAPLSLQSTSPTSLPVTLVPLLPYLLPPHTEETGKTVNAPISKRFDKELATLKGRVNATVWLCFGIDCTSCYTYSLIGLLTNTCYRSIFYNSVYIDNGGLALGYGFYRVS